MISGKLKRKILVMAMLSSLCGTVFVPSAFGQQTLEDAKRLNLQARKLVGEKKYTEAIPLAEKELEIRRRYLGPDHKDVAICLENLAVLYLLNSQYEKAEPVFIEWIEMKKRAREENDSDYVRLLNTLARLYKKMFRYEKAEPLYIEVKDIKKRSLGEKHPDYAESLDDLSMLYYEMGQYDKAEPLCIEVKDIRKEAQEKNPQAYATSLSALTTLYQKMGQYDKAEPLALQAIEIDKKAIGEKHPDYARDLNNLALLYYSMGQYEKAEPLYIQAGDITKNSLGEKNPFYARRLNNLAILYETLGQYDRAEKLLIQARDITKNSLGEKNPVYATMLDALATLYKDKGQYDKAEPLYIQSKDIRKETLGEKHHEYAGSLNNLAILYQIMGQYDKAETLYIQAKDITKNAVGEFHPSYGGRLSNLAQFYYSRRQPDKAEPLLIQARDITKKSLGEKHLNYASVLDVLATLYMDKGQYDKAESLLIQARDIRKEALGEENYSYAQSLNNIGNLYYVMGQYEKAERLLIQANDMVRIKLGENHPGYAASLRNLVMMYATTNHPDKAVSLLTEAMKVEQNNIVNVFGFSSESAMRAYLDTVYHSLDILVSLFANKSLTSPNGAQTVLDWVLRRKAIILDSLIEFRQAERLLVQNAKFSATRARYQYINQQLSSLPLSRPKTMTDEEFERQITNLRREQESLQADLNRLLSAQGLNLSSSGIDVTKLKQKIPAKTALVEFVRINIFGRKPTDKQSIWEPAHYFAFVLTARNDPQMIDLGEAKVIDDAINSIRGSFTEFSDKWQKDKTDLLNELQQEKQYQKTAKHLYDLIFAPVQKQLGAAKTIYLAPDYQLNLIPFEALVDADNKYLIENYRFAYLTSGRDLLREKSGKSQSTAIFAYPDYDMKPDARAKKVESLLAQTDAADAAVTTKATDTSQQESVYSGNVSRQVRGGQTRGEKWERGEAMLKEAEDIEQQMKTTAYSPIKKYVGGDALEESFKRIKSPRVLHVSTHGFFPDERCDCRAPQPGGDERTGNIAVIGQERLQRASIENPLLSCGLVLAGANTIRESDGQSGLDDGWVTAEEIALMNLQGTELVVLSACGSGLGKVSLGEGVYGLRRAFQNAGARTIVSTLFSVPDEESRELMKRFYEGLKAGRGKLESLRGAQLNMIKAKRSKEGAAHPFFWAGFVLAGAPE